MRLTILGGGGFRVPLIHRALLRRPELEVDEVVLYDTDPARLAVIASVLPDAAHLQVRTSTSLPNAMHGADFVFSAIRVGGAAGRVRDERRALDLGVLGQETVGAGGLTYGLRTLPVILRMAQTMLEVAPTARLINFTNPAGMITEALRGVLGDKVVGICDSPSSLVARVCRVLGVSPDEVEPDYVGINHLGWLRGIRHQGAELLPALLADDGALAQFEEGRLFGPQLLRQLGAIPNEYLYFYYRQQSVIATLLTSPTRGEVVLEQQQHFYAAARADPDDAAAHWAAARAAREQTYLAEARAEPRDDADVEGGGGYEQVALDVLAALSGKHPRRLIVNTANARTLPQLPADLVVELPASVDAAGAVPLPTAGLSLHQLGLIASVRASERAVIEAVTSGSRSTAMWALSSHPLVNSPTIAAELLGALLADEPGLTDLLR